MAKQQRTLTDFVSQIGTDCLAGICITNSVALLYLEFYCYRENARIHLGCPDNKCKMKKKRKH